MVCKKCFGGPYDKDKDVAADMSNGSKPADTTERSVVLTVVSDG